MKGNIKAYFMMAAILIILSLSGVVLLFDATEKYKDSRCGVDGCNKKAAQGKIYCSEHLENLYSTLYGKDYNNSSSSQFYGNSYQSKTSYSSNEYTANTNSKMESSASTNSKTTKDVYRERDLSFDPDDYDDPDEYADDAWDEDFDDYDDAYEYWEDNY